MTRDEAEILIAKYISGEATPDERRLAEYYFQMHLANSDDLPNPLRLQKHNKEIWSKLTHYIRKTKSNRDKLYVKIAMTALTSAVVTAVLFGVYYFSSRYEMNVEPGNEIYANDVAPGKNGATITLANGKMFKLSGMKGTEITEIVNLALPSDSLNSEGKAPQLTVSTAKGQMYQFTLPDGTGVWLNADSKLEFPSSFSNSTIRSVRLSGEGYFEVVKDKAHPFIVKADKQTVEVLGTHFNVNSYGNYGVTTSLIEGSVKLSNETQERILKAGERGVSTIKGIMMLQGDVSDSIDWKKGDFIFHNESLKSIMNRVARWYTIDVVYSPDVDQSRRFTGSVSRHMPVSAILRVLQATKQVKFKIEGRKVYVE